MATSMLSPLFRPQSHREVPSAPLAAAGWLKVDFSAQK
jgi:hypothetical protein